VRRHRIPVSAGDAAELGLETVVREGLDAPAVVAHEVVVVFAGRVGPLEAGNAVAEVDPLHQAGVEEALEGAVHAREPHPFALGAEALVHLLDGEAAVLAADEVDDQLARSARAAARGTKPLERLVGPRPHDDNDNRSQSPATVRRVRALLLLAAAALVLGGCGAGNDEPARPTVVAALYPLAWAAENVAGARYEVIDVTPPGAEPHDVEISPSEVETIRDADLVVHVGGGFQPAVEDAVDARDGPSLDLLGDEGDPHVWLDPAGFAAAAVELGRALARPEAGRRLAERLRRLDRQYAAGLERCERRVVVTSHAAFGRLADRYGLTQVSLAGRSPEAEPGPQTIERLVDDVRASGATAVFTEPLVSDRLARTVAREAGVEVATLDPVEGLSEDRIEAGDDYLDVMRDNLAALREALGCP